MSRILVQAFKTLSRNEQLIFVAAFLIFVISFIFISVNFLDGKTVFSPVSGGRYIEGIIGQPSFINPVFSGHNDSDRDLVELIFSPLSNLAESYKVNEAGKIWNIRLKEGVWHDGKPITSDDVIFTIKIIQDPDSRSPLFSSWQRIAPERISEREIKLTLPETYAFFESTLKELRPIPKHLFESLPAANLRFSDYNLEPIGNGPFKFVSFKKERSGFISEYHLGRNESYFNQEPYLEEIVFKFYQNEDELIKAFNSGAIDGFGGLNPHTYAIGVGVNQENLSKININHRVFELRMPRYYAIFLNPSSRPILKDKDIRLALNYAVDKKALIENIFNGKALLVRGPLVLGMKGYAANIYAEENFSLEKANQILDNSGWQLTSEGTREKKVKGKESDPPAGEARRLEFNLVVPQMPFLIETSNLIKDNWSKIGVKLNLIIRPAAEISDETIKNRDYEMIIFGHIFGNIDSPDLSSFWHSFERFYPGFNLALYENKNADALIESIRKNLNERSRERDLAVLQSLIIQDMPAIFLYSPHYFYIVRNSLNGFDGSTSLTINPEQRRRIISLSSDRFKNIEKWYVKTARVFK